MKPNMTFDNKVDLYEAWFEKNHNILNSEVSAIKQLLSSFTRGIEIGTGTGIFATLLGIKDGVEPSVNMSKKADTLENKVQEIKIGVGEGVFAVIKAKKGCLR